MPTKQAKTKKKPREVMSEQNPAATEVQKLAKTLSGKKKSRKR